MCGNRRPVRGGLEDLEQSLAIQREIGDRAGEAATLNNISQIYRAWGSAMRMGLATLLAAEDHNPD